MTLQAAELGWIAGTLDVQGLVVYKKNSQRSTKQSVLVVQTRHRPVVQRLSRYTGTDPALVQTRIKEEWNRAGCKEHCPTQHHHVTPKTMPTTSRWQVTGSSLVVVLYNVLPYLTASDKAAHFREAMEYVASVMPLSGQGRGAIDKAMNRLEGLGWDIPAYLRRVEELTDTKTYAVTQFVNNDQQNPTN